MFKKPMVLLLMALMAGVAVAATMTASWQAPTTYTDGTSIGSAPITFNLYQGSSGAETAVKSGLAVLTSPITVTPGVKTCAQVTAVVAGVESARTPEVCVTPAFPIPAAPTGLTIQ